jgi:hypothetical protein
MKKTIKERVLEILEEYGEFEDLEEFGFAKKLSWKEFKNKYNLPISILVIKDLDMFKAEVVKYILEQDG